MWPFNGVPKARLKQKYGFEPTQAWLDHLRLSSVRIGDSGAFVSPNGLILTNHHVGRSCILGASTKDKDLMAAGFYARTRAEEIKCAGLEAEILVGIEDITSKVFAGKDPGGTNSEAVNARNAAVQKLQQQCSKGGLQCDPVPLYGSAIYHLYKYKKYSDVRLVFAPEFGVAFLGGDPDNYTFPRYDLDIAFFRVYDQGQPVHSEDFLHFSRAGAHEGDVVFAAGNPNTTEHLCTYAQLEFLRDFVYPAQIKALQRRERLLKEYGEKSQENARMVAPMLWDLENRLKAIEGYSAGLHERHEMEIKLAEEKKLRATIARDPKLRKVYGDPWGDVERAIAAQKKIRTEKLYPESAGLTGRLASYARTLVRAAAEMQKPNTLRLSGFREAFWPMQERELLNSAPVDTILEEITLTDSLAQLLDDFGAADPLVQKVLGGKTPSDRAHELVTETRLGDAAVRRSLLAGGQSAIDQSTDPLITLLWSIDAQTRLAAKQGGRRRSDYELTGIRVAVGRAAFAVEGMTNAPDATGNLRLSFGIVEGNQGAPTFTNLGEAFTYAESKGNKPPYELPERWMRSKGQIDSTAPLNFVSTVDVIGGSSGSPLVNADGELVGVIFDANQAMLSGRYLYQDANARAIVVDVRGIIEALRHIYQASSLVDEITNASAGNQ
jgi:hypothetical protein